MSALDPHERDLVKCEDMRIHTERARQFLGSYSLAEFRNDALVQDAVIRCIEVVGEAARLVSVETRNCAPSSPWSLVIGMRNVLAHDYGAVDLDRVYTVVTEHLPAMIKHIRDLIVTLEKEVGWREKMKDDR
ncbi:MAG: HepT-like ribonuclease domain-containing protein [Candidatus Glassbacteria bacterium]